MRQDELDGQTMASLYKRTMAELELLHGTPKRQCGHACSCSEGDEIIDHACSCGSAEDPQ